MGNAAAAGEWVGAYAGRAPPHHDAVRESGERQHLDIVFQRPRFEDGDPAGPAQATAFLNGVAVQIRLAVEGPNAGGEVGEYEEHGDELSIHLQEPPEGGSEVRFRNAWIRPLVRD